MSDFLAKINRNHFFEGYCLLILIIGLTIRSILMPLFTYPFDIEHWAVIMQNMESGNALFGLTGYFYTPVWGYILGFEDLVYNFIFSLDLYGERIDSILQIENMADRFFTATTTTPTFNVAIKIPLVLCDIAVGYLLYSLVYSETNDVKKSTIAFTLWFLCPIVIYESSVQAMFDCFSALFVLITLLSLKRSNYFLAGIMFTNAALLKFFPFFCITIFIAYILKKEGLKKGAGSVIIAFAGSAIAGIVVFLPTIMDGTFENAFSFVFDRAGSMDLPTKVYTYSLIGLTILESVILPILMFRRSGENLDRNLILYSLLVLVTISSISLGPQYCIVYIPLLAYMIPSLKIEPKIFTSKILLQIVTVIVSIILFLMFSPLIGLIFLIPMVIALKIPQDKRLYIVCFAVIAVTSTLSGFFNNSLSDLTSAGVYLGIFDPVDAVNAIRDWESIHIADHNLPGFIIHYSELVKKIFCLLLIVQLTLDIIRPEMKIEFIDYVRRRIGNEE